MDPPVRKSSESVTTRSKGSDAQGIKQSGPAPIASAIDPSAPIDQTSGVARPRSPTGHHSSPISGASKLIRDSGDSRQLINTASASRITTSFSPSSPPNQEGQNADFTNHGDHGHGADPTTSLHDELWDARIESTNNDGRRFLPVNKLDDLITLDSISKILEDQDIAFKEDRASIAKQIWKAPSPNQLTTRRKIFAVLALMEKAEAILEFIGEKVFDSGLPFIFDRRSVTSKSTGEQILLFQNKTKWRLGEIDLFEKYQYEMMAPYFELSPEGAGSVGRMPVDDRIVLPFTEVHGVETEGAFSTVCKVKIHPAHYNEKLFSTPEADTYFAVKTLNFDADATILDNKEVQSLIRLNNANNPNLIRLLVTFQYQKRVHMVFPWADGNLQDFWQKRYPESTRPIRDHNMAIWVAQQCLGLALGLKAIHHNTVDEVKAMEQGLESDVVQKRYGRHGDFKPENVLWFRQEMEEASDRVTGILKVSDFGFADFHASRSKNKIPFSKLLGMTPTYRAPEWDVKENVAPSYDLWSFGCVLLEFAEWYLGGWEGVKNFEEKRIRDSVHEIQGYREDNFFNPSQQTGKAVAKASVVNEFDALRHHDKCSDFMLDMLDLVQDKLLRMRPGMRGTCEDVVSQLDRIYRRCREDESYCTKRLQHPRERTSTQLSELSTLVATPKPRNMEFSAVPSSHSRSASGSTNVYSRPPSEAIDSRRSSIGRPSEETIKRPHLPIVRGGSVSPSIPTGSRRPRQKATQPSSSATVPSVSVSHQPPGLGISTPLVEDKESNGDRREPTIDNEPLLSVPVSGDHRVSVHSDITTEGSSAKTKENEEISTAAKGETNPRTGEPEIEKKSSKGSKKAIQSTLKNDTVQDGRKKTWLSRLIKRLKNFGKRTLKMRS